MWCNQVFSLIQRNEYESGEDRIVEYRVVNNIVCDDYERASQFARLSYGSDAIAVDTTRIPVQIGDTYDNGKFYRNGEEVLPNPTQEEQIMELTRKLENQAKTSDEQAAAIESILLEILPAIIDNMTA